MKQLIFSFLVKCMSYCVYFFTHILYTFCTYFFACSVHYNSVHISVNTNILFHKNQMQDILSTFFFFFFFFPSSDTFYNVECIYM